MIFSVESLVPPTISAKKSLSSWIQKVADRAGIKLWQKPFQNCRSSRDTELRKKHPAHLVNRWLGHTQKVAEDHYIQDWPDDFIDAYNAEKNVGKTVGEHAGMGCSVAETDKKLPTEFPTSHPSISMVCSEIHCNSRALENAQPRLGRT